jgi:hypothetical protein
VTDPVVFARGRQGGWKRICEALASEWRPTQYSLPGAGVRETRCCVRPCQAGRLRSSGRRGRGLPATACHENGRTERSLHRRALGVHGVVVLMEHLPPFVAACGRWLSRRGRSIILSWRWPQIADNRHRATLPENPSNITLSRQKG